jgi:hypothetical protein
VTAAVLERPITGGTPEHERTTEDHQGPASHIVFVPPEVSETATAWVLRARIEGFEVEALCGYRWFPTRDPKQYPVCQRCVDVYQQPGDNRDDREELPDA